MARRKRRRTKLNLVVLTLVAIVAAFCILSSAEDKHGMELGLPSVDLPSLGFVDDFLDSYLEQDSTGSNSSVPVSGSFSDAKLQVHWQDMGQADSILIIGPKRNVLIDAGENNQGDKVLQYLSDQGIKKLDIVIGTHPHSDHIGGLDTVIRGIEVDKVVLPAIPDEIVPTTQTYTDLLFAIAEQGLQITVAEPGKSFDLGDGAKLTIMAPLNEYRDLNNMSVATRLVYGDTAFLFTGDAEASSEEDMIRSGFPLSANVLDVGHHGSNTSSTVDFLRAVSPQIAVISCGLDNSYGHPHREVLEALEALDVQVLRTDRSGAVVLYSDGGQIGIATEAES